MMLRLQQFFLKPFHDKVNSLWTWAVRVKGILYYRWIFGSFGRGSVLRRPIFLSNPRFIHIGEGVSIREGARLEAVVDKSKRIPELKIGNCVLIEQNAHIVCHSRVEIGPRVTVAPHCAIVDVIHPYEDVDDPSPVGSRISDEDSFVEIGEGAFLGFGVVVLPNVRIGKHAYIGANSVVTRDVPAYTIVAGAPASALRRYDFSIRAWVSCPKNFKAGEGVASPSAKLSAAQKIL
jgi:acetyltransferase-like isoleucine patch superfamily enzyme